MEKTRELCADPWSRTIGYRNSQGVLKYFEEFKLNAAIESPLATFDISIRNPGHLGYALDILVFNN
jgi:hypothetical protein